ncbi:UBC-like protein [Canariomyces notabilis]|uniref:UBC-like protein n=1 Tax=Canariomyces notabilis TaxID=2074819 RepID=A0AAN6TFZ8_9PEZI|nr:UBC-like protein [Canariomyces arenarius]
MASPRFNTKSPTIRRILREAQELTTSPSPDYHASPLETDLFEWHFTLRGPPHSAFEGGIYHGRIVLPPSYPLRPPSFRFLTPSGRFETNREICLSISGHHEETWQPAWGVRTALVALRSFMETDVKGQLGGLEASDDVRRRLARESSAWRCPGCGGRTNGEIMAEVEERCKEVHGDNVGKGRQEEVKVPEELKMGWRDEMTRDPGDKGENGKGKGKGKEEVADDDDEESARLAEGFVQTALTAPVTEPTTSSSMPPRVPPTPAPPNSTRGGADSTTQQLQMVDRRTSGDEVWLDRLIIAVAILLAAVVAKVMMI